LGDLIRGEPGYDENNAAFLKTSFYRNTGLGAKPTFAAQTGAFNPFATFLTHPGTGANKAFETNAPWGLALHDVNGDGLLDLVTGKVTDAKVILI
jgi:hypothetical protein